LHVHRFGVHTYGPEHTGTLNPVGTHWASSIRSSRYILRDNSFLGTAGTYTSSNSHSRTSVAIPVYRRIGTGLSVMHSHLRCLQTTHIHVDAPDFYESSFWKDSNPISGLGGWGDPNADFSVPDGGFSGFHLTYPSPHIVRRNFTLRPFGQPIPFFTEPQKEGNASFSASVIESILEASAGDFKGFQTGLEAYEVRA